MKKLFYTLSMVAFFAVVSKAQAIEAAKPQDPNQVDPKKKTELAPPPGEAPQSNQPKSRMAITQKGVPASRTKETNKDAKAVEPKGQPTTEKH